MIKSIKKIGFLVCLIIIAFGSFSQETRTSLAMFSQSLINPGTAGNSDFGDAYLGVRNQYLNMKDETGNSISPMNTWLSVTAPLKNLNSGIGFVFSRDEIGFETNQDIALNYAYQIKLSDGKLGIGVNLGAYNYSFDISNEKYPGGASTDPYISILKEHNKNIFKFNSSFGTYYSTTNLYFGIAVKNINEPKLELEGSTAFTGNYLKRSFNVTAGYYHLTSNANLALMPSTHFKTIGNGGSQLNLDIFAEYNKFFIGGIAYNTSNDISFAFGVKIKNGSAFDGLRAIFVYDIVNADIKKYNSGNFEFQIGYLFSVSVEKTTKSYKSVRFL